LSATNGPGRTLTVLVKNLSDRLFNRTLQRPRSRNTASWRCSALGRCPQGAATWAWLRREGWVCKLWDIGGWCVEFDRGGCLPHYQPRHKEGLIPYLPPVWGLSIAKKKWSRQHPHSGEAMWVQR